MSSELQLDVRCLSCCGGDIWWMLTKERQAWCCLQVKLCDPCLSALCVPPWPKKRYINTLHFLSYLHDSLHNTEFIPCVTSRNILWKICQKEIQGHTVVLQVPGQPCTWPRPSESRRHCSSTDRSRRRNVAWSRDLSEPDSRKQVSK